MRVIGIRSAGSVGVARYSARLAEALGQEGVGYELASAPRHRSHAHWHLANSSRSVGWQACAYRAPFVVTVHDVLPRTDALMPVYRHWLYPIVRRAARVVVHSDYAADLLVERAGVDPRRLRKIPHPAAPLPPLARAAARRELGWPQERLIALLPGVIKPAKLVREAAVATQPLAARQGWQLALAGDVLDRNAAREARAGGALVLESPDDATYACALAAADAVLVLR